jgi:hypothetical protein
MIIADDGVSKENLDGAKDALDDFGDVGDKDALVHVSPLARLDTFAGSGIAWAGVNETPCASGVFSSLREGNRERV